jgi:hypothetical protein
VDSRRPPRTAGKEHGGGAEYGAQVDDANWRIDPLASLVIRTDFGHPDEWTRIQAAIEEPQTENGFVAYVEFVDDRANDGLTVPGLLQIVPADSHAGFAFLVDTQTLTQPERPILVVNLHDCVDGLEQHGRGPLYGTTFPVIPSEMWAVQNNLSIANVDWDDFADNDGVYRGL